MSVIITLLHGTDELILRLQHHLSHQGESEETTIDVRNRNDIRNQHVKYKVGRVFYHVRYGYRGVIYNWDAKCTSSSEWVSQMGAKYGTRQ
mgnify:CR=1 FL=1